MKRQKDFNYTGSYQNTILSAGRYLIECWGASGGSKWQKVGKGSYVSGELKLKDNTNLYIYVGEQGVYRGQQKSFNGGGAFKYKGEAHPESFLSSGGGATDVRLVDGQWNTFESLKSRIIVAAGGGGATDYVDQSSGLSNEQPGGNGGSFRGENGPFSQCIGCSNPAPYRLTTGGDQQSGGQGGGGSDYCFGENGAFGVGGDSGSCLPSSGGGGGYFGGGGGGVSCHRLGAGAGGSSFISGMKGCSAIQRETTSDSNIQFSGSIHYSNHFFINPIMLMGNETITLPDGKKSIGNEGNGYVRITTIENYHISLKCTSLSFSVLFLSFTILITK